MKIKITMKDPDGPHEAVREAVMDRVKAMVESGSLSRDEADSLIDSRVEEYMGKLHRWLPYGEYLTVLFDTDAGTATVLEGEGQ